jgi:hypothetical protein
MDAITVKLVLVDCPDSDICLDAHCSADGARGGALYCTP